MLLTCGHGWHRTQEADCREGKRRDRQLLPPPLEHVCNTSRSQRKSPSLPLVKLNIHTTPGRSSIYVSYIYMCVCRESMCVFPAIMEWLLFSCGRCWENKVKAWAEATSSPSIQPVFGVRKTTETPAETPAASWDQHPSTPPHKQLLPPITESVDLQHFGCIKDTRWQGIKAPRHISYPLPPPSPPTPLFIFPYLSMSTIFRLFEPWIRTQRYTNLEFCLLESFQEYFSK